MADKRVIIVHGWADNPNLGWLGWLGEEMSKHKFQIIAPHFRKIPLVSSDIPGMLTQLRREVGKIETDDIFVTHSLGVPLTMRYISNYVDDVSFRGLVMVAGMIDYPFMRPNILFDPPLNRDKIIRATKNRIVFYSDNDHVIPPRYTRDLAIALNAEEHLLPGRGHFAGLRGVNQFPEALQAVLKIAAS